MSTLGYSNSYSYYKDDNEAELMRVTASMDNVTLEDDRVKTTTQVTAETRYFDDGSTTQVDYCTKHEERVALSHIDYSNTIIVYDNSDGGDPYVNHIYTESEDVASPSLNYEHFSEDNSGYDNKDQHNHYYGHGDYYEYGGDNDYYNNVGDYDDEGFVGYDNVDNYDYYDDGY